MADYSDEVEAELKRQTLFGREGGLRQAAAFMTGTAIEAWRGTTGPGGQVTHDDTWANKLRQLGEQLSRMADTVEKEAREVKE